MDVFFTKLKQGEDFGRVHMANCVCLAKRLRVDTLKAIAKQFGNQIRKTIFGSVNTSHGAHIKRGMRRSKGYLS
jgi:hypothetical protein